MNTAAIKSYEMTVTTRLGGTRTVALWAGPAQAFTASNGERWVRTARADRPGHYESLNRPGVLCARP